MKKNKNEDVCGDMHNPRMFNERILCRKCGARYHKGQWIRKIHTFNTHLSGS